MFRHHTSAETQAATETEAGTGIRQPARRARRGRRAVTMVAASTAMGLLGLLGTVPAHASVAPNGFEWQKQNFDGTGCTFTIGSQASPVLYGIGEVDVTGCPVPYNIVIYVYLDHANSKGGALTTVAENRWAGTTQSVGVRTLPSVCGYTSGHDYWTVVANVSFNGGHTWSGFVASQQWVPWESGRC